MVSTSYTLDVGMFQVSGIYRYAPTSVNMDLTDDAAVILSYTGIQQ